MTRVPRVAQVDQELDLRDQFLDDFDLLGHQVSVDGGEPGEVASRSGETVGDSDLGPLADGGASVDLELPDIATASFYQAIGDRAELMIDVAWTGWSSVQYLNVVRDTGVVLSSTPELWEDTWRYAVGMTWELNDAWKLRGGLAFDETPVPDETRTARLPDTKRKWVAIGARWTPSDSVLIDLGYAHLFSDDVPINQNEGSTARVGLLNGQQESAIDIVSVQIGMRF